MKIQAIVDQLTVIKAQILRFGIQAVSSVSRPAAPGLGQVVFEGDTGRLMVWNGTAWTPLVLGSGSVVTVVSKQVGSGSGSTTGTSWADYPGSIDLTIVKKFGSAASKLVVFGAVGGFVTTGNTLMSIGLSFGGVDHKIGDLYFNSPGTHLNASCQDDTFAAQAAGSLTGRVRWHSDSANQLNTDANDAVRLTLLEVLL